MGNRRSYSPAQQAEAVALARSGGAELAATTMGMDVRYVRKLLAKAGDPPELDGTADGWQRLLTLAQAKVESALLNPKLHPVTAATIGGIAERNLAKLRDRPTPPDSAVAAREAFLDWMAETLPADDPTTMDRVWDAVASLPSNLLIQRANAEPGMPHRAAILAWFSGRPEVEAGDVLDWAKAQVLAMLAEHGTILAWREHTDAQDERDRLIKARADVLASSGMRPFEARQMAEEITA